MFRLVRRTDQGTFDEISGTVYEGLTSRDLAVTVNLRLEGIVAAYTSMSDPAVSRTRANYKILDLINAADQSSDLHSAYLLRGAYALNEWLIEEEGERPPHLINRWQIQSREGTLTPEVRREIRSLRVSALREKVPDAAQVRVCCSLLLGDLGDVEDGLTVLSDEQLKVLKSWPIWRFAGSAAIADSKPDET